MRQSHGEIVWIVCGVGGHRDQVPVARVHNHYGASDRTGVGNRRRAQGFLSRLLDGDVNGQVNALTGLGRRPDVFRLAITQTVHQDGFNSIPAAQLLVKRAFDSDHPSEIRHPVIEEDIFVGRRIIALQMTEQMACRGVMGVHSHGLNFQVKARQVG